jgi:plastocyanin
VRRYCSRVGVAALATLVPVGCVPKQNLRESAPAGEHGTQTVGVDLTNAAFTPRSIEATAGKPLVVELHNKGFTAHTFTIDAPHVDVVVDRGHDRTVTITLPSQPGRLRFYCRFHAAEGMRGQISYR